MFEATGTITSNCKGALFLEFKIDYCNQLINFTLKWKGVLKSEAQDLLLQEHAKATLSSYSTGEIKTVKLKISYSDLTLRRQTNSTASLNMSIRQKRNIPCEGFRYEMFIFLGLNNP